MYVTVDIGATTTRLALSEDLKKLHKENRFATSQNFSNGVKNLAAAIDKIMGSKIPKAMAVAIAGILDSKKEKLLKSPNLRGWTRKPLASSIAKLTGTKVYLGNDADIGGLGEAVRGVGKGKKIVGYLTLGTGIGGTRIVNGKIDVSAQGLEPGHQIIIANGRRWSCGQRGCLEAYAAGSAIVKYPVSWQKYARLLGQGVINMIFLWSPDIVALGGGLAADRGHLFIKQLRKFVKENLKLFTPPPIAIGKLGDKAALYGGLEYLKSVIL